MHRKKESESEFIACNFPTPPLIFQRLAIFLLYSLPLTIILEILSLLFLMRTIRKECQLTTTSKRTFMCTQYYKHLSSSQ